MADVVLTTSISGIAAINASLGALGRNMNTLAASVTAAGRSMQATGKLMTASITLPVVLMGVSILKTVAQFEQGMNRVQVLTGATASQMQNMEKIARQLGATTAFTATDAARAMGFMAQAGLEANTIMSALPATLNLAAAAGLDMARAADVVTNIMAGFGKSSSELNSVVNILVATFTSSNVNLNQLAEAMKLAGPVAKGFGLSIEETAAALGIMGNAGFQGSLGGTALRNSMIRLASPTKENAKTMEELGIKIMGADGQMVSFVNIMKQFENSLATPAQKLEIFGTRAGPAMVAALEAGSGAVEKLMAKIKASGEIARRAAEVEMKGLAGAWKGLVSAAQELQLVLGDSGMKKWFNDIVRSAAEVVRGLATLDKGLLLNVAKWAAMAAVLGPVILLVGFFVTMVGSLATKIIFLVAKVLTPFISTILLLSKYLLVLAGKTFVALLASLTKVRIAFVLSWAAAGAGVIAIAAIGLSVGFLIKNFEELSRFAPAVMDQLKAGWSAVVVLFIQARIKYAEALNFGGVLDKTVKQLKDSLTPAFVEMASKAKTAIKSGEDASKGFSTALNSLSKDAAWVQGKIGDSFKGITDSVEKAAGKATKAMGKGASSMGASMGEMADDVAGYLIPTITNAADSMASNIERSMARTIANLKAAGKAAADAAQVLVFDLGDDMITIQDEMAEAAEKQAAIIKETTERAAREAEAAAAKMAISADNILKGFVDGTQTYFESINDFAALTATAVGNIWKSAEDHLTSFIRKGKLDFSGFVDSVLDSMARLAAQGILAQLIGGGTGGGGGGLIGGIGSAIGGMFGGGGGGGGGAFGNASTNAAAGTSGRGGGGLIGSLASSVATSAAGEALGIPSAMEVFSSIGSSLGIGATSGAGTAAGLVSATESAAAIAAAETASASAAVAAGSTAAVGTTAGSSLAASGSGLLAGAMPVLGPLAAAAIALYAYQQFNRDKRGTAEQIGAYVPIAQDLNAGVSLENSRFLQAGGPPDNLQFFLQELLNPNSNDQELTPEARQLLNQISNAVSPAGKDLARGWLGKLQPMVFEQHNNERAAGPEFNDIRSLSEKRLDPFWVAANPNDTGSGMAFQEDQGMAIGGSRVFTTPTLLSVAENGPEFVNAQPLSSGGGAGAGAQIVINGDAVFDDLTADDFARRIIDKMMQMQVRGIA